MKKTLRLFLFAVFSVCILSACGFDEVKKEEKYTMDALYSYGGDLEHTKVSYKATIFGTKQDIEKIDAYEVLSNMDYLDLMLENGPHHSEMILEKTPYFKITGQFTFNTSGLSKEEITKMKLLKGIVIIDKDKNEVTLEF